MTYNWYEFNNWCWMAVIDQGWLYDWYALMTWCTTGILRYCCTTVVREEILEKHNAV